MENFKLLTLEDKDLFKNYENIIDTKSYEYSFVSLYLWRNLSNTKFSIIDNCLVINKNEPSKGNFFMMPYGYKKENLQELIEKLKIICPTNNIYLLGDIEDTFINDLKKYTNLNYRIIEDRNDYEYIYNTKDLIDLQGKKYHSKKNQYNYFVKNYDYTISTVDSLKKIEDCIGLLKKWHNDNYVCCEEMSIEISAIEDILLKLNELNLSSICIYVNNNLVGFSIGETFKNTAIIHVERCNKEYKGVYSFINREFLIRHFSSTTFVNREEDCGSTGLKKAKLSYHPVEVLRKSLIAL